MSPESPVLALQPMIPSQGFDIFPLLTGGCSEGLDAFRLLFLKLRSDNVDCTA